MKGFPPTCSSQYGWKWVVEPISLKFLVVCSYFQSCSQPWPWMFLQMPHHGPHVWIWICWCITINLVVHQLVCIVCTTFVRAAGSTGSFFNLPWKAELLMMHFSRNSYLVIRMIDYCSCMMWKRERLLWGVLSSVPNAIILSIAHSLNLSPKDLLYRGEESMWHYLEQIEKDNSIHTATAECTQTSDRH